MAAGRYGYMPDDPAARESRLRAIITPLVKSKLLAAAELEYLAEHYELADQLILEIEHELVFAAPGRRAEPERTE